MKQRIYYDSRTGNVERFVNKIQLLTGWEIIKINSELEATTTGHLITYTTGFGEVPQHTASFMKRNAKLIKTVSSSGNRNWGCNFARAAETIADGYKLPVLLKFELSGNQPEVQQLIQLIAKGI
ncbi:MAG: class Ib ribonucleoside-diphosphate reductase assembly flavoprotein NrdI [Sphingobacteriaceae bacterium]